MKVSRRDLSLLLPALLAVPAEGQESSKVGGSSANAVLPSKCYLWDKLPVHKNEQTGMESRNGFKGTTHTGSVVGMHISSLPLGQMPHPPHRHAHEEMMFVREGALEATVSGQTTRIGPGSVFYVASNEEHGIKSVGDVTAQYFVVELGAA